MKNKVNVELVNYCEFDSYASKSYCAIHNVDNSLNLGDITKVNENEIADFNMIVGGSPCQDFSVAGNQAGSVWECENEDCEHKYNPLTVHWSKREFCPECGSKNLNKSRSSLLVEWLRIIRGKKPNFGIYENVKNIVGKQFKETTFKIFEEELNEYGYNTYWKVLNAKDYSIPQNRERVYLILIKKELDNGKFEFPKGFDNGTRLRDMLDENVDESFYISQDKIDRFITSLNTKTATLYDSCQVKREGKSREYNDYAPTLSARDYKDPRLVNVVGKLNSSQDGVVVSSNGIAPTHTAGHGNCPKIIVENKLNQIGFMGTNAQANRVYDNGCARNLVAEAGGGGAKTGLYKVEVEQSNILDSNINSDKKHQSNTVYDKDYICPTIDTMQGGTDNLKY